MAKGLDTATPCTQPVIDAVKRQGYTFIVRYYCTGELWKKLRTEEAQRLSDSGIWVVAVFQDFNNAVYRFSDTLGAANAKSAYLYARDVIRQPDRTPIYFAVDFDATDRETKGPVRDYFRAVNQVFAKEGGRYHVGVYGSGAVCQHIKDDSNLARYSWLSMSTGWRNHRQYDRQSQWNLKQIAGIKIAGVEFDTNESSPVGGGGWRILLGTEGLRESL